jgi:hypothetical protein
MRVIANDEQRSIWSANPGRPADCGGTEPSTSLRLLDDGPIISVAASRAWPCGTDKANRVISATDCYR